MGLFGFGKTKWDEEKSDVNKNKMKELFCSKVEDGESYKIAYGFGLNIENSNYIMVRKKTYQYTSLIIGYRESDMSIVMVQTTPELEGCSEPKMFKKGEIKKAKIAAGEYAIYHAGGIMAGYTSFSVISDNDENYLVYCHQEEVADEFKGFFKRFSKK